MAKRLIKKKKVGEKAPTKVKKKKAKTKVNRRPKKQVVKKTIVKKKPTKKKVVKKRISRKGKLKNKRLSKTGNNDKLIPKPTTTRRKPLRNKSSESKFEKISNVGNQDKFKEMGKRVQNHELLWSHFAIENNIGYHYYLKLK